MQCSHTTKKPSRGGPETLISQIHTCSWQDLYAGERRSSTLLDIRSCTAPPYSKMQLHISNQKAHDHNFRHSEHSKGCTGPINPHYSSARLSHINSSSSKQHQRYVLFICPDGAPQVWNIFLILGEVRLSTDFVRT